MIWLPNTKDNDILYVIRCPTWPLATTLERHKSPANPAFSGSGVCLVYVHDLDAPRHLRRHKPPIVRWPNFLLLTLWVHRVNSSPCHHHSEDLGTATTLIRMQALLCSWLLLSAPWWYFAMTALCHGKDVHSVPGCRHTGFLCFPVPVSLSINISLLGWCDEQMAVKEQKTEVAMSDRDAMALEKILDSHVRPELVVVLVFVAWQSFNSRC